MDVRITSRHQTKTTKETHDRITDEMNKLDRYYDKITSCHVILESVHAAHTMEVVLNVRGQTLTATATEGVMSKAIDEAVAKIERQLKKINEKVKSHKGPKGEESEHGVN